LRLRVGQLFRSGLARHARKQCLLSELLRWAFRPSRNVSMFSISSVKAIGKEVTTLADDPMNYGVCHGAATATI